MTLALYGQPPELLINLPDIIEFAAIGSRQYICLTLVLLETRLPVMIQEHLPLLN